MFLYKEYPAWIDKRYPDWMNRKLLGSIAGLMLCGFMLGFFKPTGGLKGLLIFLESMLVFALWMNVLYLYRLRRPMISLGNGDIIYEGTRIHGSDVKEVKVINIAGHDYVGLAFSDNVSTGSAAKADGNAAAPGNGPVRRLSQLHVISAQRHGALLVLPVRGMTIERLRDVLASSLSTEAQ